MVEHFYQNINSGLRIIAQKKCHLLKLRRQIELDSSNIDEKTNIKDIKYGRLESYIILV